MPAVIRKYKGRMQLVGVASSSIGPIGGDVATGANSADGIISLDPALY